MERKDSLKVVGKQIRKKDAIALACGGALFTDDVDFPGLLEARVLRSPHAHARIVSIDASKAAALEGVACVVLHHDVPRIPFTTAGQGHPEPSPYDTFILDSKVRFVGDAVALVAAADAETADRALSMIEVVYEPLEPVLSIAKAFEQGAPVIHDEPEAVIPIPIEYDKSRNLAAAVSFEVGNVEAAAAAADRVACASFSTHFAAHCAIETHICIAWIDPSGRVFIRTSTQVPFHARRITARALGIKVRDVRVIKPRIGGGFGGKQEVLLEPMAAFLARKTGKPVRLRLTRPEEFFASRTRHPQDLKFKATTDITGRLTSMDLSADMNTGAYGAHASTVLNNTGSKTLPLFRADNVRFRGRTAYTNLPVGGAYRGYGATQGAFAVGVVMDMLAAQMGMDPVDFLLKNATRTGESSPVFKALGEGKAGVEQSIGSCGLAECIAAGAKAIGWREKRQKAPKSRLRRGVGMTILMQGSSIPQIDMGSAWIKMNDDGSFNLAVGATDLGTGSDTVLAQIAAEEIGVGADFIIVTSSDTDVTPFDTGAYASSTTYLTGEAVRKAAADVKAQMLKVAAAILGAEDPAGLSVEDGVVIGGSRPVPLSEIALRTLYGRDQFQVQACASHVTEKSPPPFSAHFVEVEVDTRTGMIGVVDYVAAVDCGTAINPRLAEGQVEGAVLNGISYALCEEFLFDDKGAMRNASFRDYKIHSALDAPNIKVILVPTWEETGPFGAKSVSEIAINGPLPAISNAVFNAVGIRLTESPFTPEKVLAALKEKEKRAEAAAAATAAAAAPTPPAPELE